MFALQRTTYNLALFLFLFLLAQLAGLVNSKLPLTGWQGIITSHSFSSLYLITLTLGLLHKPWIYLAALFS